MFPADSLACLACPHCHGPLSLSDRTLRCASGHAFDLAREGYVNLLAGSAHGLRADSAEMVAARAAFLEAGHYEPLAHAVAEAAAVAAPDSGCIVDVGAGTGYYLGRTLDALGERAGIALDLSKAASKRAARAHPQIGAVVCDAWGRLPVRSGAAAVVLDVFAPRNAEEFHRVLAPGGALVVVTPTAEHLAELVEALGLLSVDPLKEQRLAESLGAHFELESEQTVHAPISLEPGDVETLVGMGPSAWHADPERRAARIAELPQPITTTLSARVAVYRPR